jgi:hypothetical protein
MAIDAGAVYIKRTNPKITAMVIGFADDGRIIYDLYREGNPIQHNLRLSEASFFVQYA